MSMVVHEDARTRCIPTHNTWFGVRCSGSHMYLFIFYAVRDIDSEVTPRTRDMYACNPHAHK